MDAAQEKLYWDEQIPTKNDHDFYAFPKEQLSTDDVIRAREALKRRQRRGLERSIIRTAAELDQFHYSFANQVDEAYLKVPRKRYHVMSSGSSYLKDNSRSFTEKLARLRKMVVENKPEPTTAKTSATSSVAASNTPNNNNGEAVYRSKLEDIYDGEFDHIYTNAMQTMEYAQISYAEDVKNIGNTVEQLARSSDAVPGSSTPPGPSTPPGQPSSPILSSIPMQRTGSRDPRLNPRIPSDPRRR